MEMECGIHLSVRELLLDRPMFPSYYHADDSRMLEMKFPKKKKIVHAWRDEGG
jgi:hypothetical protein